MIAEDSGQSTVPIIVSDVVPLMPGLHERLTTGIEVPDIGCEKECALMGLARAYPNSTFTGYDLSKDAVSEATRTAEAAGLENLRFVQRDLTHWQEPPSFDWITAFDSIHARARPVKVLAAIRNALRPDDIFFMQDIDASSEPVESIDHPLGAMLYAVSCMHCMTVSLARGGMGLGATRDHCWWSIARSIEAS